MNVALSANRILLLAVVGILSPSLQASEQEVFQRCSAQLTGRVPGLGSPLAIAVRQGEKTGGEACGEILNGAELDANTGRLKTDNGTNRLILRNFHMLHMSWFQAKEVPLYSGALSTLVRSVYDVSAPALYYTKSLFDKTFNAQMTLRSNQNLRPIRSTNNPPQPLHSVGKNMSDYIFSSIRFAPQGLMFGIESTGLMPAPWSYRGQSGNINYGQMYGLGLLGTQTYILKTAGNMKPSDGAEELPRTWARDMYKDLLCRDLPVIRAQDTAGMVRRNSVVGFRKSSACVVCHASIDRAASTLRNVYHKTVGTNRRPNIGSLYLHREKVVLPSENGWPATRDANYYKRPPKGNLYYRNYKGELVDLEVANLNQLATRLSQTPDYYICTAKRYYEYFTGFQANTGDLMDATLSPEEQQHRDKVIDLGLKLRQHKNAKTTILEILQSTEYKKSVEGT